MRSVISLAAIIETIGEPTEHPLARRTWRMLAMQRWRKAWRQAESAGDYGALDNLDRSYEMIMGI